MLSVSKRANFGIKLCKKTYVDNTDRPTPLKSCTSLMNGGHQMVHLRIQGTEDIGGEKGLGVEGPAGRKLWIGGGLSIQSPRSEGRPHLNTLFVFLLSHNLQRILGSVVFCFLYAHLLLLGFLIENQFVLKWSSAVCMLYASRYIANGKGLFENLF